MSLKKILFRQVFMIHETKYGDGYTYIFFWPKMFVLEFFLKNVKRQFIY